MLRPNFFENFFKYKRNKSSTIVKFNSNKKYDFQKQINIEILEIDEEITKNSQALLQAQIVKLRSTFSKSNNVIEKIGKNIYKQKVEDSIDWHQKKVKELYLKRKTLQINLEKVSGIYWLNQIKRFLIIILIGFLTLLCLFIFFSGFMIIIYLLPLIILIFIGYLIANKNLS